MESIGKDTLDNFYTITGFDISSYLSSYKNMIVDHYNNIVSYYSGLSVPNRESFKVLEEITKNTDDLHNIINIHVEELGSYEYWILIEKLYEIRAKIDSINNISKWLRSSITSGSYKAYLASSYTLSTGETLESVSRYVNEDINPENDWAKIAIDNNINEEDYTPNGGVSLKVNKKGSISINVQSVVDNLSSDNVYGRDVLRKLTFNEYTQDLEYLTEEDTLMQSVNILGNLKTGNNPRYPEDGITKDAIVGQPLSVAAYPTIIRQLQKTFASDDTIKSVTITDIIKNGDTIDYVYEVRTVLDENKQNNILSI